MNATDVYAWLSGGSQRGAAGTIDRKQYGRYPPTGQNAKG